MHLNREVMQACIKETNEINITHMIMGSILEEILTQTYMNTRC